MSCAPGRGGRTIFLCRGRGGVLNMPPMSDEAHRSPNAFLGLDVGDSRIGVAVSRSGVIAEPLATITRLGRKRTLDTLEEMVEAHGVGVCVVGLPLLESGVEGEQAEKTRAFARSLARRLPALEIVFHDERHSSGHAREIIGKKTREKGAIDRVAAAVILQEWLDSPARKQWEESKGEGPSNQTFEPRRATAP